MPETPNASSKLETAILGGGCFWCLEAVYQRLQGVTQVISGYAGGKLSNPPYQLVCTGLTGHTEVVQVTFDPAVVSFREVLEIFFTIHDPTTRNRQGADVGTQYRSAIFYHSDEQKTIAERVMADLQAQKLWPAPFVTELSALNTFYPAEDYHQNYFNNNPYQGYCQAVVAPKVAKFRQKFADKVLTP